jgi:molybdate/tungstate transport system substrate-binding protein
MQISEAFRKEYPGIRIFREAAGSRACARKIADLGRSCDVFASADHTVIDTLLIPEFAHWNIKFATNEMCIAYGPESRRSSEITEENWHRILLSDDVHFGRSDPNSDPCGYRAVMMIQLAESYYGIDALSDKMLEKDLRYIRPKETDLLALLELREIDYIYIYRSVAEQHGLQRILLPDEINLREPELAHEYSMASVEISGTQPGETIVRRGSPILYGVTIPNNSPNPRAAIAFVSFLLDEEEGQRILVKNGQSSAVPSSSNTYDKIPAELRRFARTANE